MSTAVVPVAITCPDWCKVPVAEHVGSLWDYEANCIHYSRDRVVRDTEGYQDSIFMEPRMHEDISVYITSQTRPEGRETAGPIVHLDGRELSVSQALALAEAIRETVYTHRVEGGVA